MKKALATSITLALAVSVGTTRAGASTAAAAATTQGYQLSATLTAKQVTKPRPGGNVAKARGSLIGRATAGKHPQIAWTLTYSGLTGRISSAEVRYQGADGLGRVILLCTTNCSNGMKVTSTFNTNAQWQPFIKQALAGKVDVVLKTKRNPDGELRGVGKTRLV